MAWRLMASPSVSVLVVCDASPGWPEGVTFREAMGVEGIVAAATAEHIDLVVVGPEAPLAAGLVDACEAAGLVAFGPRAGAARLESSKAFAKEILVSTGITTASTLVVDSSDPESCALGRRRCALGRVVLKADGLAAGKGVEVCPTAEEALVAFERMSRFGAAAATILLEDLLIGQEVSVFGISDGVRVVALPSAQDHKRLGDLDTGPNTGGMGAIAPCPLVDAAVAQRLVDEIHTPVVAEMARRGTPFRGVLYAGLMMTAEGPFVLEFNARFGDPECQVLMALWKDDPVPWLYGSAVGALPSGVPAFHDGSAAVIVLAAAGYPDNPERGAALPEPRAVDGVVFHAGTKRDGQGVLRVDGGRVLGVVAVGTNVRDAVNRAYGSVPSLAWPGMVWRKDIGARWM